MPPLGYLCDPETRCECNGFQQFIESGSVVVQNIRMISFSCAPVGHSADHTIHERVETDVLFRQLTSGRVMPLGRFSLDLRQRMLDELPIRGNPGSATESRGDPS